MENWAKLNTKLVQCSVHQRSNVRGGEGSGGGHNSGGEGITGDTGRREGSAGRTSLRGNGDQAAGWSVRVRRTPELAESKEQESCNAEKTRGEYSIPACGAESENRP